MFPFRLLLAAILPAVLLAACASSAPPATATAAAPATFVLVRHAEKASDDPRDPSLTSAGEARALRLAEALHAEPIVAVYATAYRRTRQTAQPTAQDHRLAITTYDAAGSAVDFARRLRQDHPAGTVLIVGHSNTVPAIAAALCQCQVAAMDDNEYDRRITVRDGGSLIEDRY